MSISFSWDRHKDLSNRAKHKVSFDEAMSVFFDEHARLIADPDHSIEEDRYVLMGVSYSVRILVVVHTHKDDSDIIRIISARKATRSEIKIYEADKNEKRLRLLKI